MEEATILENGNGHESVAEKEAKAFSTILTEAARRITTKDVRRWKITFILEGTSPLLVNRCDPEKLARDQGYLEMLDPVEDDLKRPHKPGKRGKPHVDELFHSSIYYNDASEHCVPAAMIRSAMAEAAELWGGIQKTEVFGSVRIPSKWLLLKDEQDMPIAFPTRLIEAVHTELRKKAIAIPGVRAMYPEWRVRVPIIFWPRKFDWKNLHALVQYSGHAVGIGAHRVGRGGDYGSYDVAEIESVEVYDRYARYSNRDIEDLDRDVAKQLATIKGWVGQEKKK